ncbi:BrnA antitoxin family protein [Treponema sp. OMZ 906]|jgi:hypothetical protein|uniref:BrnA antitoxin family protein n=1 Tax=Treponema sp. OMZ 906 TaxID=2563662 RepID=UPI0020A5FC54|nr:BrnA antitoxin family protein [Treponema sp. OMZ 906]UTC54610.1 BrnA antitoxin family protein [Treponema sp. OMZ 906]
MKKTQQHIYKTIDFPPLTDEQKKELEVLESKSESEIDYSDIPANLDTPIFPYYFQSLKVSKTAIHTKIDNDNLEWLRKDGKGYQARLNNVIRWARMNNCPISTL